MLRSKVLRLVALLLALALLVAACADDAEEVEEEPEEDPVDEEVDDEDDEDDEVAADGMLLGTVLPETGPLADLGPPQIESVNLAVEDINDAGGVLGADVSVSFGDEAGDTAVASETVERLLGEGVHGIIGAAASGITNAITGQITGAEVVQCSGSNTAPVMEGGPTGFYVRTAPTDALQGIVLGEVVISDGFFDVSIMARADDYGEGFLEVLSEAIEEQGGSVLAEVLYDPEAASFTADVENAVADDPEAIIIIGFDEGAQVISDLIEAGYGPSEAALYTADGMQSSALWEDVDPDNSAVLVGMRGTAPGGAEDYAERLLAVDGVDDPIFGAQVYDCVVLLALAAEAAGSIDPSVYQAELRNVSQDGEVCTSFAECRDLLADGADIDYQGPSGNVEWDDIGDITTAEYVIFEFDEDGVPAEVDRVN